MTQFWTVMIWCDTGFGLLEFSRFRAVAITLRCKFRTAMTRVIQVSGYCNPVYFELPHDLCIVQDVSLSFL